MSPNEFSSSPVFLRVFVAVRWDLDKAMVLQSGLSQDEARKLIEVEGLQITHSMVRDRPHPYMTLS